VVPHKTSHTLRPLLIYALPHLTSNNSWFIYQSSDSNQQRHLLAKHEKVSEKCPWILPIRISFIPLWVFEHAVKSYDMEPKPLLNLRRKSCYGFLSPLKIHRPRPGLNQRAFDPIASTIITRPPRATQYDSLKSVLFPWVFQIKFVYLLFHNAWNTFHLAPLRKYQYRKI
jgi:hypothetical protein